MRKLFFFIFLLPLFVVAQTKQVSLEDIYKKGTFRGEQVRSDFGQVNKDPEVKTEDLKDETGKSIGEPEDIIFSTKYPTTVLIRKGIEQIYRHSSKRIARRNCAAQCSRTRHWRICRRGQASH